MKTQSSAAWSDTAAHKSGFVTANGIRLHYLDWGGLGPALILIHGGLDNAHDARGSRIETRWIDDPNVSDTERGKYVQFWADTQSTGGTAIDAVGNIYASDPDKVQLLKIDPTGKISTFVADRRMLFVDEMWIDEKGFLWMPAVQLNRVLFKGELPPQLPYQVLKVQTGQKPVHR
jgi:hypothetical protein